MYANEIKEDNMHMGILPVQYNPDPELDLGLHYCSSKVSEPNTIGTLCL